MVDYKGARGSNMKKFVKPDSSAATVDELLVLDEDTSFGLEGDLGSEEMEKGHLGEDL